MMNAAAFLPCDYAEDSQGGHNVPSVKPVEKLQQYLLNDPNILEGAIEKTPADQKRVAQEGVVYFYRRPAAAAASA